MRESDFWTASDFWTRTPCTVRSCLRAPLWWAKHAESPAEQIAEHTETTAKESVVQSAGRRLLELDPW